MGIFRFQYPRFLVPTVPGDKHGMNRAFSILSTILSGPDCVQIRDTRVCGYIPVTSIEITETDLTMSRETPKTGYILR